MYGQDDCHSLNDIRAEKSAFKKVSAKKLPPTDHSFEQHMLRAVYQLFIWRNCTTPVIELPNASEFSFEWVSEILQPKPMNQPAAAPELLNDVVCQCSPDNYENDCVCRECEQPCTAACSCAATCPLDGNACANPLTAAWQIEHNSDSEVESENEEY